MRDAKTDFLEKLLPIEENRTAFLAALIMERCKYSPDPLRPILRLPAFNPHQAARIAEQLVSIAVRIRKLAEKACNEELSDRSESIFEKLRNEFRELAESIGFETRISGDPRGPCAYLIDPDKPRDGDGWGEGWAVYR